MSTYHIAKFDCFKSSRLEMQSKWEEESIYVHLSEKERKSSIQLTISVLRSVIKQSKDSDTFVFHAQSSLIYLILGKIFFGLNISRTVYDIHDLNVTPKAWGYLKFRAWFMALQECLVLRFFKIKSMTVSTGLAMVISRIYHVPRPKIVRNISANVSNKFRKHQSNRLVYFGTLDRLPKHFFTHLEQEELTVDVYGRFNYSINNSYLKEAMDNGVVNFKGEYNPKELEFLLDYDFLYYNILPYDTNYRFAGPNKFFQSLSYGLKVLIPSGYSELKFLLSQLNGSFNIIEESVSKAMLDTKLQPALGTSEIQIFLDKLKLDSKNNYQELLAFK